MGGGSVVRQRWKKEKKLEKRAIVESPSFVTSACRVNQSIKNKITLVFLSILCFFFSQQLLVSDPLVEKQRIVNYLFKDKRERERESFICIICLSLNEN